MCGDGHGAEQNVLGLGLPGVAGRVRGRPGGAQPGRRGDRVGAPLGGSRARLMTTLVLRDNAFHSGLQAMCEGGGQANVTIIERLG